MSCLLCTDLDSSTEDAQKVHREDTQESREANSAAQIVLICLLAYQPCVKQYSQDNNNNSCVTIFGADLLAFVFSSPGRSWDPWRDRGLANCSLSVSLRAPRQKFSYPPSGRGKLADRDHILAESAGGFVLFYPPHVSATLRDIFTHQQCRLNWI